MLHAAPMQELERKARDVDAAWEAKQEANERSWVSRLQVGYGRKMQAGHE